jgi:hypothetical protein
MKAEEKINKINELHSELKKLQRFQFQIEMRLENGKSYGNFFMSKKTKLFFKTKEVEIEIPKQIEIKILAETIYWIKQLESEIEKI